MNFEAFSPADLLRWIMTAALALVGGLTLLRPCQFAAVCLHVPTRGLSRDDAARVEAAARRRKVLENIPASYDIAVGFGWLLASAACAAGAGAPALCYAAASLATASGMAAAYLRLHAVSTKRVAALNARTALGVVPWYWFALAAATALAALVSSELRAPGWAAFLICASALTSAWLAWRVTTMPALLSGDDLPAERFVDDNLRFGRATAVLLFAFVQVFVFVTFEAGTVQSWHADAHGNSLISWSVALAWLAFSAWTILRKVRPQRVALP